MLEYKSREEKNQKIVSKEDEQNRRQQLNRKMHSFLTVYGKRAISKNRCLHMHPQQRGSNGLHHQSKTS